MTASPMSGFSGTNVTLSNTPNANYGFSGYSITGTAPSTGHTVSNIRPNSAVWYGYISGLHP